MTAMRRFQPYASIAPSKKDSAYILALVPTTTNGLATITSASELIILDRQNLSVAQTIFLHNVPDGSNYLIGADAEGQSILCSGANGTVCTFDVRSQNKVNSFKLDRAITALASNGKQIAVGTEFKDHQAIVSLWDTRQNKQVWQNAENSDEVTALDFHPIKPEILLAGGDDGLVSLFDTQIVEDDESLVQAFNHGPIHKAGFLGENRIFALSSDQNLSIHPVSTPGDEEDPQPTIMGDLRPLISCQYVIDVMRSGADYVLAAGTNIGDSRIDFVKLENATNYNGKPNLDVASKYTLQPAHGEEVVRAVFIDDQSGVIYSAGEDGNIYASGPLKESAVTEALKPSSKHSKNSSTRYKPY